MEIFIPVLTVTVIGIVAGVILSLSAKFFDVPTNPKIEKVRDALPGANCGGCGYSGCDGYAEAIVNGADITLCPICDGNAVKAIGAVMGIETGDVRRKVAIVRCSGTADCAVKRFDYQGLASCKAASTVSGGSNACSYSCLGLGDCVNACENAAISIVNGIAVVSSTDCIACRKCESVCPRGVIEIGYLSSRAVKCSSNDKGAATRKVCTAGCIGCGKCVKVCEAGAIKLESNLAYINGTLCTNCGKCESECPVKVIGKS